MDEESYTIEWADSGVGTSNGHQIICESRSDDLIEENNDIEEDEEYLVGEEIIPSTEIITISNSLDQIAAENLIYMAQDGSVAVMGDLIEEQVEQVDNADYNEQQYFECQVTEEVITDDWVQQQGEDRVEVPVDQLVGDIQSEEVMVPLPTDEYTTSRPYPCDFCSRRFRKKANLMNHMIAHKNDRPHICNLCGARYIRKSDLLGHLKVHAQMPDSEFVDLLMHDERPKGIDKQKVVPAAVASASNSRRKNTRQRITTSGKKPPPQPMSATTKPKKNAKKYSTIAPQDNNIAQLDDIDAILGAAQHHEQYYERHNKVSKQRHPVADSVRPFVCQVCGVGFVREKALNSHFLIHGVDNALECDSCSDMFWTVEQLQEHQATQHGEDVTSGSEYEPEEKTPSDDESDSKFGDYYCNMCGMSFHRLDLLKRHSRAHNQAAASPNDELSSSEQHCCNVCGSTFAEALDLLAHAEVHTRASSHKCTLCGEIFSQEQSIRAHISKAHAKELTEHTCRLCGKHCKDERTLLKHAWDHSKEKNHSCLKCGKTFYNKARLKRHMQSHRNKSVACNVCGKNFPDGRTLMNHRHSHTNVSGRQFECLECGKTFGSRSSQQIHMRIHTGERPYGCRFCWKAFADGGTLRKHERIHTGEKPYACPVCPRAFNQRVVLREHIRSHHSSADPAYENTLTPYYCSICNSTYGTPTEIIAHLIDHSDANTLSKRQPTVGPRKYKRRRKLKPEELERLRVQEPSSKREPRKRQHSEREDLYSNDTFDDTDTYVLSETYDFPTAPTVLTRSKRERNTLVGISSPSTAYRVKTEVISHDDNLTSVLDDIDDSIDDDIISPSLALQSSTGTQAYASARTTLQTRTNASSPSTERGSTAARMIHTKKKVVPTRDGRRDKSMIALTQIKTQLPAPKLTKSNSVKNTKKQPKRSATILTNGSTRADKTTTNLDVEREISQNKLLLELSKKSVHYSPDVVSDLEEILRSPVKSREERSSFTQSNPLGDLTLSPNYFDHPKTVMQRNTRSSKRLSNRNLSKELDQASPTTSFSGKSTRQRTDANVSSQNEFAKDNATMATIAMHIKQEKEVSYTLSEEPPAIYTCEMCSAAFSDRAQLLVHVPIHI